MTTETNLSEMLTTVASIANALYAQYWRTDEPEAALVVLSAYEKAQELYDGIAAAVLANAAERDIANSNYELEKALVRRDWDAAVSTNECLYCRGTGKCDNDNECGFCHS